MPNSGADINLTELLQSLWARKWLLGGITGAGAALALIVVMLLPNVYRAEALLAPKQADQAGGISALAAQYGGLANLAGIDLADASTDKTALGLEILRSRQFVSGFIERHELLVPLIAANEWDRDSGELLIDSSIFDASSDTWVRKVRAPKKTVPSLQEAYDRFVSDILHVEQDSGTGFVTIAVEHYSPVVAEAWVSGLVRDLNATVMTQDVGEAEEAISYLEQQIAATPLADLQNVFFSLIEEQTKTVMLAKMSPEYLFRTVDPAVVPEMHARPRRVLIVFAGLVLSLLVGAVVVLLLDTRSAKTS
jgi:uncharacterized protein involved in exopolysaccharide biosynthesis